MSHFLSRDDVLIGTGLVLLAGAIALGWLIGATFGDCQEEISERPNNQEIP